MIRVRAIATLGASLGCVLGLFAQQSTPSPAGLNSAALNAALEDRDPARRTDRLLTSAETAFDNARDFYSKGEIQHGDAQLEDMLKVLHGCADSLDTLRKSRFYKKAELRVANLQRRMQNLVQDVNIEDRGWAEYTERKLEEVHDQLLAGVMRK